MSKLGNINNLYGKKFSLVCANTTGSNILNMHNLPQPIGSRFVVTT